jgi:AraC-like DNA-binding protein
MDVLSDALQVVRLTGAVFLDATFAAPWAIESPPPSELAHYLHLPSDCVAQFHIVVRGQGWFSVPGYASVLLRPGDAILFPRSTPHVMSSGDHTLPVPMGAVVPPLPPDGIVAIKAKGRGESTHFICGYLHCDQRFNPLIGALPVLIVVRPEPRESEYMQTPDIAGEGPVTILATQIGDWLQTTLRQVVEEAIGEWPGKNGMLARLSEILFVEVVRRYMQQLPESDYGWLAGVQDPLISQVLRMLHAQPDHSWTVEELAMAVSVARSTLAQRFSVVIGETPMRYLAGWRIQLAKHLLKQTNLKLPEIARHVGFESAPAFNRAFKRHVGQTPAAWRLTGAYSGVQ